MDIYKLGVLIPTNRPVARPKMAIQSTNHTARKIQAAIEEIKHVPGRKTRLVEPFQSGVSELIANC